MSNVYVTAIAIPSTRRDKRVAPMSGEFTVSGGGSVVVNNTTVNTTIASSVPSKVSFGFIANNAPSITSYDSMWSATYGEIPSVRLWTIDGSGNFLERSEKPKFIMVGGVIDSIVYDLAIAETGFIILS